MGMLSPLHIVLICAVALLLLGPKRLPEAGRSLGRGLREFKHAVNSHHDAEPATLENGEKRPERTS